nr:MAG TPA: hypothetical protein [Caudoviricetes sp.]
MAKGASTERTSRRLYGIGIYPVLGHAVHRHRTQADAGF